MSNKLTPKQEAFCQAYIRLGDKSAAYREVYSVDNMKPATVNNNAYKLFANNDILTRIEQIRLEAQERNKATLDELIIGMSKMIRFDIADLYDEKGNLKSIHDIPKHARAMISQIKTVEEYSGKGSDKEFVGYAKEIKILDRLAAYEKLMKHLGGYEKDNMQKNSFLDPTDREKRLAELKNKM